MEAFERRLLVRRLFALTPSASTRLRPPPETNVMLPAPRIMVLALYVLQRTVPVAHDDWIWRPRVAGWSQGAASRERP